MKYYGMVQVRCVTSSTEINTVPVSVKMYPPLVQAQCLRSPMKKYQIRNDGMTDPSLFGY